MDVLVSKREFFCSLLRMERSGSVDEQAAMWEEWAISVSALPAHCLGNQLLSVREVHYCSLQQAVQGIRRVLQASLCAKRRDLTGS